MQLSFNGLEFIKDAEGFRDKAYLDGASVWTIGYGTTRIEGKPVEAGQTCTRQQASQWLAADVAWAQTAVNKLVKVPITQNMFDALVSFVYNLGEPAFAKSSMLRFINEKRFAKATEEFPKWSNVAGKLSPGLYKRRIREQQVFATP